MVNVEQIKYENTKALDERNQLVDKLNELINIINVNEIETIAPKLSDIEAGIDEIILDISTLNASLISEVARIDENVAGLTYVKEVLSYEATPTTFKACVKMRDDTVVEMVLPPVSETDIGVMTPSAYAQVWINKAQIEQMLLGTSIPTGDLETATPTQVQLTTLWTTAMARDPADGDRVMNTFDNVVWLFATGMWHAISESSTPQATNSTLGTVMGSTADGKTQVELDGTLSVNGWDEYTGKVDENTANIVGKVSKTGDTMTGRLVMSGTAQAQPRIEFKSTAIATAPSVPAGNAQLGDIAYIANDNTNFALVRLEQKPSFRSYNIYMSDFAGNSKGMALITFNGEMWATVPVRSTPGASDVVVQSQLTAGLLSKLDKVTATQDSIKAYCVDTEGNNILLPYQTPTETPISLPTFSNILGIQPNGAYVDRLNPLTIPSSGVIFLQKLISDYTISVLTHNGLYLYPSISTLSFLYYYYTGPETTCNVTYIGYNATDNYYYAETVEGTLTNDRIYFLPKALSNKTSTITVVRVTF